MADPFRGVGGPQLPNIPAKATEASKAGASAKAQEAGGENLKIDGNTITMTTEEGIFSFEKPTVDESMGKLSLKPNKESDSRFPTREQAEKFLSKIENKLGLDSEFADSLAGYMGKIYPRERLPGEYSDPNTDRIVQDEEKRGTIRYMKTENKRNYLVREHTKIGVKELSDSGIYQTDDPESHITLDYKPVGKNKAGEDVFKWVRRTSEGTSEGTPENPILEKLMKKAWEQENKMWKNTEDRLY